MKNKERLDNILVSRAMFPSREAARTAIMDGAILVDGAKVTKAGTAIGASAVVEIIKSYKLCPYVSRGGLKLERALKYFVLDVKDRIAIDAGASTGGFTDCLLKSGARFVYAVDVGYGQLDWSLRQDSRVKVLERVNIRNLKYAELYGREEDNRGREEDNRGREEDNRGREEDNRGREEDNRGREEDNRGREEDNRGREEDNRGREEDNRGREEDNRGREEDNRGREEDNRGREEDNHGREEDNRGREEDNRGREEDNRGREEDNRGREERNYASPVDIAVERADLAVMDVSFISVTKTLPALFELLAQGAYELIVLIKPQFEAGRQKVGKGGVVRDFDVHLEVLDKVISFALALRPLLVGLTHSPIKGPQGNIEYLLYLKGGTTRLASAFIAPDSTGTILLATDFLKTDLLTANLILADWVRSKVEEAFSTLGPP